ncbi:MAG: DNA alkylation repair protein [Pseudobacteriovorax sp.]|nr:DNA alkylation repair protein [Pseudobacteriovorax sp.]
MRAAVNRLEFYLQEAADPKTNAWFDNYLKGAILYRGVKTPQVRSLLIELTKEFGLTELSIEKQLEFCDRLMRKKTAEDKFAAIFYLQRYLVSRATPQQLLAFTEQQFAKNDCLIGLQWIGSAFGFLIR